MSEGEGEGESFVAKSGWISVSIGEGERYHKWEDITNLGESWLEGDQNRSRQSYLANRAHI